MKKYIHFLKAIAIALTFIHAVQAQQTRLSGVITDPETQQPLVGASVAIKGKIAGTVTDNKGKFELNTAIPVTLVISMVGYER